MEQWKGGSRWCQAHTALWVDLLHWGPDERFPSFAEEPNKFKAIFRCLPRPWNKAEKIAVVNSFSSMWLEINSALAAEGQRPSQWQAQPEASTKTKDKRDLWLSAMIAVAPPFLHWKIGLSTHTESRCDARRFIDASKAACGVQIYSSCGESRHRHSQECLLQRGIVDVCASRLKTCSCKSKMRIWRMFKSPRPIFNVGRKLKCCSFTFWTDSHQKEILPQVTSSNWNSLLSCNSINTPSTLTMGSQGFSLWLALVGAMQGKMAVLGSQALRLQRFNLYDGRTEFSSAAPAALQLLRWPHRVLQRCACRASTF